MADSAFLSPDPASNGDEPARERLLRVLLYFDVFSYPLTWSELRGFAFAPEEPDDIIRRGLRALIDAGSVVCDGGYYRMKGREGAVERRRDLEMRSALLWRRVEGVCRVLARVPYVRGASVTGTLAKNAAGVGADVDLIIFARENRVWVCRTLIAAIRRTLPGRLRRLCCANVFLSEQALTYDQRTMYVAVEIASSRPVLSPALGSRFVRRNEWIAAFLPGVRDARPAPIQPVESVGGGYALAERLLDGAVGDCLDVLLARCWSAFWARRYGYLDGDKRARLFRIDRKVSTNHLNDFQTKTLDAYAERLASFGLDLTPDSGG